MVSLSVVSKLDVVGAGGRHRGIAVSRRVAEFHDFFRYRVALSHNFISQMTRKASQLLICASAVVRIERI